MAEEARYSAVINWLGGSPDAAQGPQEAPKPNFEPFDAPEDLSFALMESPHANSSGRFDDPQAANPPRTRGGSHNNFHIAAESVQPMRKPVDRHAFHAASKHLRQGRLIGMTEARCFLLRKLTLPRRVSDGDNQSATSTAERLDPREKDGLGCQRRPTPRKGEPSCTWP